jgi:hypothetical protein
MVIIDKSPHPYLYIVASKPHWSSVLSSYHQATPTMGIQARLTSKPGQAKDEESLPLTSTQESDKFKDHSPSSIRLYTKIAGGSLALVYLFFCLYSSSSSTGLDFPWPKPEPSAPPPSFIAEGIKQCEIISRPPPSHKQATAERKYSDRFVKGTKATWLKNGTVWTGEKGGEEVLYGVDVLLDGGVVRKIGKPEEIQEMMKSKDKKDQYDEVELGGAWVTPGRSHLQSGTITLSPFSVLLFHLHLNSCYTYIHPY